MDEELLRGKGLEPERGEIAAIDGFALRIGQRAALVPAPGAKVYGLVFSITRSKLDRLYSESSVQAYQPQAVLAQLASGGVVAAPCYNLRQPPVSTSSMRSIFWLNFLEGPKTNSKLGRKRRQIRGTQFPFPLADGAQITIRFSFFSGPPQSPGI